MRYLPPLSLKDHYYSPIEAEIQRIFDEIIYKPLARIIKMDAPYEIRNSIEGIIRAIDQGSLWYEDGEFHGEYNSTISKQLRSLGAIFNVGRDTWSLPLGMLPPDISIALVHAENRYESMRKRMISSLNDINVGPRIEKQSTVEQKYLKTIDSIETDFRQAAKSIAIPVKLSDDQRSMLAEQWGNNLDLYIKDWTESNILKLRQQIQPGVLQGNRASSLVKTIQENYGVSKSKAKFLARQETSLLMSKFQETRYRECGVNKYKWSISNYERARPDHRALDGKIFSFDQPPVTCKKTGARNNPGEDFNCYCVAIPMVE